MVIQLPPHIVLVQPSVVSLLLVLFKWQEFTVYQSLPFLLKHPRCKHWICFLTIHAWAWQDNLQLSRRKFLIFSLKKFANCCKYLCLGFVWKKKLLAGETEPRRIGGFVDTRWTPDAELCGRQWLSCLFTSSFQVSDYFEVIGNYETQLEYMKYSGLLFPLGTLFLTKPSNDPDSSSDLCSLLLPESWNNNYNCSVQIMSPLPWF